MPVSASLGIPLGSLCTKSLRTWSSAPLPSFIIAPNQLFPAVTAKLRGWCGLLSDWVGSALVGVFFPLKL